MDDHDVSEDFSEASDLGSGDAEGAEPRIREAPREPRQSVVTVTHVYHHDPEPDLFEIQRIEEKGLFRVFRGSSKGTENPGIPLIGENSWCKTGFRLSRVLGCPNCQSWLPDADFAESTVRESTSLVGYQDERATKNSKWRRFATAKSADKTC